MWSDGKPITEHEQALFEAQEDFWFWLLKEAREISHRLEHNEVEGWLKERRKYYETTTPVTRLYHGLHRKVRK